uniref:Uncharacterized protein n=2 Tax=Physcomitrium patens TaxID=3218 RepID=A0A2K1J3F5_PHYPA|nr:hypothetical protein PHYPA_021902 [Physcomitrium patens]
MIPHQLFLFSREEARRGMECRLGGLDSHSPPPSSPPPPRCERRNVSERERDPVDGNVQPRSWAPTNPSRRSPNPPTAPTPLTTSVWLSCSVSVSLSPSLSLEDGILPVRGNCGRYVNISHAALQYNMGKQPSTHPAPFPPTNQWQHHPNPMKTSTTKKKKKKKERKKAFIAARRFLIGRSDWRGLDVGLYTDALGLYI